MIVSQDKLQNSLRLLASLIDAYGDEYWPLFERLERELEDLQGRKERMAKYLEEPRKKYYQFKE